MQFNISNFYPSITEDLVMAAISLANNYCTIKDEYINMIQKPILYHVGFCEPKNNPNFLQQWERSTPRILLLQRLRYIFYRENIGLYRDDGVILLRNSKPQNVHSYDKEPYNHTYISKKSNHSLCIVNNLHKSVRHKISTNSSSKYIFDK